nr:sensor histidine kinase [Thermoclostridium sp.]
FCFMFQNGLDFYKDNFPPLVGNLPVLFNRLLIFITVYVMIRLIKLEMLQGKQLRETLFQLKTKTKQSGDMYSKLKKTTMQLEEMTALKERNRISREIHDTVGHTLTTVLIELEAGQRLIPVNPEEATERLELAKGQVRQGLDSIRQSVRMLGKGQEIKALTHSLMLLIEETMKHGNVFIKYDIAPLPPLSAEVENILYRALAEGLTNGMKHGESTAFVFQLKTQSGKVCFFLEDNGKGTDEILFGYGLTAMKDGVEEAGGAFHVSSACGEGFTTRFEIPLNKGETDG